MVLFSSRLGVLTLAIFCFLVASCDRGQDPIEKQKAIHAELLAEMYRVIFLEPPRPEFFAPYLNALSQGASLEGIYNGMTHSAHYRELEKSTPNSAGAAIGWFKTEFITVRNQMKEPTPIRMSLSLPLEHYGLTDGMGKRPLDIRTSDKVLEIEEVFKKSSFFTLKRVLADEARRLFEEFKGDRDALVKWYAGWSVRLLKHNVDFGHEHRNRNSKEFHLAWAKQSSDDRLLWEILTRLHRLLNAKRLSSLK